MTFTPKERDVLALIAKGLKSKEIAQQLGRSESSIHISRRRLALKMGGGERMTGVGMLRAGLRLGLVRFP